MKPETKIHSTVDKEFEGMTMEEATEKANQPEFYKDCEFHLWWFWVMAGAAFIGAVTASAFIAFIGFIYSLFFID